MRPNDERPKENFAHIEQKLPNLGTLLAAKTVVDNLLDQQQHFGLLHMKHLFD